MNTQAQEQVLRRRDVETITGLSRSGIYQLIAQKRFPTPISLGNSHAVGWLKSEIDAWIQERVQARNSAGGAK